MCDLRPIYAALLAGSAAVLVAVAACVVAIAMNLGIFSAAGAPVAMGIATGAAGLAMIALAGVAGMLASCLQSLSPQCVELARQAIGYFAIASASLLLAIGMAAGVVILSGVPFGGAVAIGAFSAPLVVATAFLQRSIDKLKQLEGCEATAPPQTTSTLAQIASIVALGVSLGFIVYGLFNIGWAKDDAKQRP